MGRHPSLLGVDIGERFKALRNALGYSTEMVSKRTRPPGSETRLLDRRRVERIEKGQAKLTSVRQIQGMARAYGLTVEQIDAFIAGTLDVETAIDLARGKTAEVPFPDSRSAGNSSGAAEALGEKMASAITLRQSDLAHFPNLEFCLEYHRRNGKTWDRGVVAAARGGHFGDEDLPTTGAWDSALDRLQAVMRHATAEPPASTRPKLLTPRNEKP